MGAMYDGPPRAGQLTQDPRKEKKYSYIADHPGNRGGAGDFRWDAVKADDKYRGGFGQAAF
jgi:hypothetical protein